MEDLCRVTERDLNRFQRRVVDIGSMPGCGNEEVEQRWLLSSSGDEHVAASAGAGQEWLADPRSEHCGDRRVDCVAAGAQNLCANFGSLLMACGDHSCSAAHQT